MVITSQCIRGGSSTQPLVVNCKRDANCCKKPPVITGSNLWLSVHLPGINSKMVLSHTIWLNASYFSRWYCTDLTDYCFQRHRKDMVSRYWPKYWRINWKTYKSILTVSNSLSKQSMLHWITDALHV